MTHAVRRHDVHLTHPEWSRNATIYQINTRQFTPEGTFEAASRELTRLHALGVRILWLMPVHEIGAKNRKGALGSPYAVRDYYSVNPEFGTLTDLRAFVDTAHALGMHVILDWVANHTAWDNPLVEQHPEWYARDWDGRLAPTPWWDWDDVVDLDFHRPGVRSYMTEAMAYWVREADVDGFRCDVAGLVPTDFWEQVRAELWRLKPVFLLAEAEHRDLHDRAFDATYGWSWNLSLHHIASGKADVTAMRVFHAEHEKGFPDDAMRLLFVSNHDKNSWEGTEFEQFGDAVEVAVVLSMVSDGIPMVYNGQEAGNEKRLDFFDRDPIVWREHPMAGFYRRLIALKAANQALWNGRWGGRMVEVRTDLPTQVLAFTRRADAEAVLVVANLSPAPVHVTLTSGPCDGTWTEVRPDGSPDAEVQVAVAVGDALDLPAWGYRLLVQGPTGA